MFTEPLGCAMSLVMSDATDRLRAVPIISALGDCRCRRRRRELPTAVIKVATEYPLCNGRTSPAELRQQEVQEVMVACLEIFASL